MKKCGLLVFVALVSIQGCASNLKLVEPVSQNSKIAILEFSDCMVTNREDCSGSGKIATDVYKEKINVDVIPRPADVSPVYMYYVGEASKIGHDKGYDYIVFGMVRDYNNAPPMSFTNNIAGVIINVAKTSSGTVIANQTIVDTSSNLGNPKSLLADFAAEMKSGLFKKE